MLLRVFSSPELKKLRPLVLLGALLAFFSFLWTRYTLSLLIGSFNQEDMFPLSSSIPLMMSGVFFLILGIGFFSLQRWAYQFCYSVKLLLIGSLLFGVSISLMIFLNPDLYQLSIDLIRTIHSLSPQDSPPEPNYKAVIGVIVLQLLFQLYLLLYLSQKSLRPEVLPLLQTLRPQTSFIERISPPFCLLSLLLCFHLTTQILQVIEITSSQTAQTGDALLLLFSIFAYAGCLLKLPRKGTLSLYLLGLGAGFLAHLPAADRYDSSETLLIQLQTLSQNIQIVSLTLQLAFIYLLHKKNVNLTQDRSD